MDTYIFILFSIKEGLTKGREAKIVDKHVVVGIHRNKRIDRRRFFICMLEPIIIFMPSIYKLRIIANEKFTWF